MLPLSQLPDNMNMLLIRNEGVWDGKAYWKITFSNLSILPRILRNELVADDPRSSVQCYTLPEGEYYLVETDRISYEYNLLPLYDL